jgi:DNA-binding transcriptional MerR regulator
LTIHCTSSKVPEVKRPEVKCLLPLVTPRGHRPWLTVGEVAARLRALGYQASPSLIRKLEREGLIDVADRSEGNYRLIPDATFTRLRCLLGLRALGLSLEEIREVLTALERAGASGRRERERLLDELGDRIGKRIQQLDDLRKVLRTHR